MEAENTIADQSITAVETLEEHLPSRKPDIFNGLQELRKAIDGLIRQRFDFKTRRSTGLGLMKKVGGSFKKIANDGTTRGPSRPLQCRR